MIALFVAPSARRQGVATQLLRFVQAAAEAESVQTGAATPASKLSLAGSSWSLLSPPVPTRFRPYLAHFLSHVALRGSEPARGEGQRHGPGAVR